MCSPPLESREIRVEHGGRIGLGRESRQVQAGQVEMLLEVFSSGTHLPDSFFPLVTILSFFCTKCNCGNIMSFATQLAKSRLRMQRP